MRSLKRAKSLSSMGQLKGSKANLFDIPGITEHANELPDGNPAANLTRSKTYSSYEDYVSSLPKNIQLQPRHISISELGQQHTSRGRTFSDSQQQQNQLQHTQRGRTISDSQQQQQQTLPSTSLNTGIITHSASMPHGTTISFLKDINLGPIVKNTTESGTNTPVAPTNLNTNNSTESVDVVQFEGPAVPFYANNLSNSVKL